MVITLIKFFVICQVVSALCPSALFPPTMAALLLYAYAYSTAYSDKKSVRLAEKIEQFARQK